MFKRQLIYTFTCSIGLLISACSQDSPQQPDQAPLNSSLQQETNMKQLSAPIAARKKHLFESHGHKRNDPYFWLRDDKRENTEVLDYLNAENDYTEQNLAHTKDLQKTLFKEMTERLEPNEKSVPSFLKGYWYWSEFSKDKEYRVNIRQKGHLEADHEILLDQNKRAAGHEFYRLASLKISPNQNLMAIAEDTISRRLYQIRIKNLAANTYYDEVIPATSGEIVWANDNQTLFYVKKHSVTLLPFQVYRHQLGTDPEKDTLVYEELDDTFYTSIYKTRSENFIGISLSSTMTSEVRFIDANSPHSKDKIFLPREKDHKYAVDHINGYFYGFSDQNAPNEKMFRVAEDAIGSSKNWQTIISHSEQDFLQDFELFDDFMVVNERRNSVERLVIRDYQGHIKDEIKFEEAAFSVEIDYNPDPTSQSIRYYYTSMTTPDSVYEYQISKKHSQLLKQDKVLGSYRPQDYRSERIFVTARDGKKIPVSIVYRVDKFEQLGNNPLLQYAYGSYGYTVDAGFSISRISLMDRGFVFAIAHIRGGQMLGRQWYEDGKKLTKLNTFSDFIDVSKALIDLKYTNPKNLFAIGGSAGGLLMGGVINMAPELYHGVIAAVPFVDVVTTMLDESIPLTTGEYDEWGNPNEKIYYDYMLSYSPYDQVKKQNYPNILVTTGLHDSQVQYWEPAKWVAKLRTMKTDHNKLLLDTDMTSGHGGKSGRYKAYSDTAKEYAFLLDLAGIKE